MVSSAPSLKPEGKLQLVDVGEKPSPVLVYKSQRVEPMPPLPESVSVTTMSKEPSPSRSTMAQTTLSVVLES